MQITVLASAPGAITVALREVRSSMSSAACLITLETTTGIYAGDDFRCAADRSDEAVVTDAVAIAIAVNGYTATVRFRTSYQLVDTRPRSSATPSPALSRRCCRARRRPPSAAISSAPRSMLNQ